MEGNLQDVNEEEVGLHNSLTSFGSTLLSLQELKEGIPEEPEDTEDRDDDEDEVDLPDSNQPEADSSFALYQDLSFQSHNSSHNWGDNELQTRLTSQFSPIFEEKRPRKPMLPLASLRSHSRGVTPDTPLRQPDDSNPPGIAPQVKGEQDDGLVTPPVLQLTGLKLVDLLHTRFDMCSHFVRSRNRLFPSLLWKMAADAMWASFNAVAAVRLQVSPASSLRADPKLALLRSAAAADSFERSLHQVAPLNPISPLVILRTIHSPTSSFSSRLAAFGLSKLFSRLAATISLEQNSLSFLTNLAQQKVPVVFLSKASAKFHPLLRQLASLMGAFSSSHTFSNSPLQAAVFQRYLRDLVSSDSWLGFTFDDFSSASSHCLPALVNAAHDHHDVLVVPVSFAYDKLFAVDSIVQAELAIGMHSSSLQTWLQLLFDFVGNVVVKFEAPINLSTFVSDENKLKNPIAFHLSQRLSAYTLLPCSALVSALLLSRPREEWWTVSDLSTTAAWLWTEVKKRQKQLTYSQGETAIQVRRQLQLFSDYFQFATETRDDELMNKSFRLRGLVANLAEFCLYSADLLHCFEAEAIVSYCFENLWLRQVEQGGATVSRKQVLDNALFVASLLRHEFAEDISHAVLESALHSLTEAGCFVVSVTNEGNMQSTSLVPTANTRFPALLSALLAPSVECYCCALIGLVFLYIQTNDHNCGLPLTVLIKRIQLLSSIMFEEFHLTSAFCSLTSIIQRALNRFQELSLLKSSSTHYNRNLPFIPSSIFLFQFDSEHIDEFAALLSGFTQCGVLSAHSESFSSFSSIKSYLLSLLFTHSKLWQ